MLHNARRGFKLGEGLDGSYKVSKDLRIKVVVNQRFAYRMKYPCCLLHGIVFQSFTHHSRSPMSYRLPSLSILHSSRSYLLNLDLRYCGRGTPKIGSLCLGVLAVVIRDG